MFILFSARQNAIFLVFLELQSAQYQLKPTHIFLAWNRCIESSQQDCILRISICSEAALSVVRKDWSFEIRNPWFPPFQHEYIATQLSTRPRSGLYGFNVLSNQTGPRLLKCHDYRFAFVLSENVFYQAIIPLLSILSLEGIRYQKNRVAISGRRK